MIWNFCELPEGVSTSFELGDVGEVRTSARSVLVETAKDWVFGIATAGAIVVAGIAADTSGLAMPTHDGADPPAQHAVVEDGQEVDAEIERHLQVIFEDFDETFRILAKS